jgi:hypothetical protein
MLSVSTRAEEGLPSWVFWLVQLLAWAVLAVLVIVLRAGRTGCLGPLVVLGLPALSYIAAYTVLRFIQRLVQRTKALRRTVWPLARGVFWAAVVVAGASILWQPLYAGIQPRVRQAAAQADVKALVSAVSMFQAHTGRLPDSLEALTKPSTGVGGTVAQAFIHEVPRSPCVWSEYRYERRPDGTFSVTATGEDGTWAVRAP